MKRIAIILFLLVVIGFLYTRYVHVSSVNAGQSNNPNFVTKDEVSLILQSNLNVIWGEFDTVKESINTTDSKVNNIDKRLNAIEENLEEIRSLLSQ